MGPEPLTDEFNAEYMLQKALNKRVTVKQFIMDNKVVVGVGNIYASESLFSAKVHPTRTAGSLTLAEWDSLVAEIKQVLTTSIKQGGPKKYVFLFALSVVSDPGDNSVIVL